MKYNMNYILKAYQKCIDYFSTKIKFILNLQIILRISEEIIVLAYIGYILINFLSFYYY